MTDSLLTITPDPDATDKFRVVMSWPAEWGVGEFAVLLAVIFRHVAHNTGIDIDELLIATDEAITTMDGDAIGGGRVQ